jgi:hypothetical protein
MDDPFIHCTLSCRVDWSGSSVARHCMCCVVQQSRMDLCAAEICLCLLIFPWKITPREDRQALRPSMVWFFGLFQTLVAFFLLYISQCSARLFLHPTGEASSCSFSAMESLCWLFVVVVVVGLAVRMGLQRGEGESTSPSSGEE